MVKLLQQEMKTYEDNKHNLLNTANGKFVLIKEKEIIGTYDTENDAIKFGIEKFGNQAFLVKRIQPSQETQNFTSNLIKANNLCPQ